jgi:hypothetical protein
MEVGYPASVRLPGLGSSGTGAGVGIVGTKEFDTTNDIDNGTGMHPRDPLIRKLNK